jgi:hypothetical protein
MRSWSTRLTIVVGLALVFGFWPGRASAQSAIAGQVKDTTGAVMPGVTVEVSSPVLIEKTRDAVTDGQGQFRIIDLRPGTYTVTFTLSGFNTVKREGILLPAEFTATVDAELRVGALEESITVSGQTPVVDVQSATQGQVLTRDLLDAVPTGRNIWGTGATLTGVTLSAPDVGGTAGMQQTYMAVHGSERRDNAIQIDGMSVNGIEGDGAIQNYFNQGMFEEMSYSTSALSAEVQSSGVRLNMIPKDGSNILHASAFISHTPGSWQSDNFTDELAATGLKAPNRVERIFDQNLGLGGPIMQNRWWFYGTFRRWGVDQSVTDSFYNADPTHRKYIQDYARPVIDDNVIKSGAVRFTFQIARGHKLSAYTDRIVKFRGHECGAFNSEEACGIRSPKRYFTAQTKYTATLGSKLLIEAGWSENDETYSTNEAQPSVGAKDVGRSDRTTTEAWSMPNGPYYFRVPDRYTVSSAVSYVTGSHAIKSGFQWGYGGNRHQRIIGTGTSGDLGSGNDLYQEYNCVTSSIVNGICGVRNPASVVVHNTPQWAEEKIKYDLGVFLQDSFTYKRLTLNPGIRFEAFNTYVPEQGSPAGRFVPARHFDKIENLPNWRDVAPRFGAVYDVFDDGKTAVKFHIGKYMRAYSTVGFAAIYNPMVIATDRRTWSDLNGDDIAQDNEIGPVVTPFNISGVSNRVPDPDIKRPYQWEYNAGVQRELRPGVSVSANWVRREFKRIFWTDNILVSESDYSVVNIPNPCGLTTAPAGCSGLVASGETIPVYNLNVAKRGQVQQVDKNSDTNFKRYNGIDFGFTARVRGGNIFGGTSIGKQITNYCQVEDPNSLRFCDQSKLDIPYLTQFKLTGTYPLVYGVSVSGTWQGYPGVPTGTARQDGEYTVAQNRVPDPSLNINYNVTRTQIPNLTVASITVPLLTPGQKYLDRWNQIDIRFSKRFEYRKLRFSGQLDIFNLLNSNSILGTVENYGSTLDRPTAILQGRLIAAGLQMTF